ncbi:undecaprenyl-phosphate galactose phosphotransferase WbaP [Vibrio crassostreae]|uniref:undecaprenyl-phosphate galactose phosphotransferase WbaP n=1 Tax=Vibrio crassostreae TaxID=246167 RepID=UPI000F4AAAB0|nr:undecaprenyl-phosphate galactose phosphotransferase WbaP [Vibrio crassostreae]NOH77547.1 undecaprenyl-phosphate galactose phosphotransferase WbaP [Vibrio crassostreae]NOI55648.1 undecaprenyl-phosphate galactose phosphotransferase WbaP [Vibrio crassostreae]ROR09688.1 undecaprenyl-phosphate galactose phosphotransferase [Vibrio crassostreae]CAK1794223.1 UDP-galactose-lipid carrier transferase [Vibrio crassostreae]CAK2279337.1 UDP-galactose-lipid carrier transferase [Vibrio crassostreae]
MNDSQSVNFCQSSMLAGKYSAKKNKIFLILSDVFSFFIAACIACIISFPDSIFDTKILSHATFLRGGVFTIALLLALLWFWGSLRHYTYRKPFWDELRESYVTLSIIALIELALITFIQSEFQTLTHWEYHPLIWLITWSSLFIVLPLFRTVTKFYLSAIGSWMMPSVIIGNKKNAQEAYLAINSEPSTGFRVEAFVAPSGEFDKSHFIDAIPCISGKEYFNNVDTIHPKVFIALEKNQSELRDQWLRSLAKHGVTNISVVPDMRGVPLAGMDVSHFFSHEVMMLRIRNNLARKSSKFIKRAFDIVTSSLLLLLLSPFFAFICFRVTRDGGSATYGHERVGLNGELFKCLKFRSMIMNSKEVLEHLLATDSLAKTEWDKEFKLKNDPRVTEIGAFLRKTSLDELPQLWNVLKGEMSLVGPRPVIDEELERYKEDVVYYFMTKPGMSGLWQVSGRSNTDYDTRVYLDAWYVKNWSLWTDLVILFKTIGVVLKRDGAY